MDTLYIVMPAYNEEKNIRNVITEWYKILDDKSNKSKIIIADSGSTDNTHSIINQMKQEGFEKIEVLTDTNRFHGPKLIALYKFAIENGADYIFQTDSDGQTNSKEFNAFWNEREKYEAIIGNRTNRGDGKDRALVERVVCLLLLLIFGVKVPDANAPFRLMSSGILSKYINRFPNDYNIPNIMLTAFFAYYDESIEFKPIEFKARQGGENSINMLKIFKIGWRALGDFFRFKKEM